MVQRIYIDTSVLGGLFDNEFSDDTKPFFERIKGGEIKIVYSELTENDLVNAPDAVREFVSRLHSKTKEFVTITEEAVILADKH